MKNNIEEIIKEYEQNIENAQKYKSFINEVREYNGYIFKQMRDSKKFENESKWLKKLEEANFHSPKIVYTYNQTIVMRKIVGQHIKDDEAKQHLYNIGQLIANLHNIPIVSDVSWKQKILSEYIEIRESVKDIMPKELFKITTKFLEQQIEKLTPSKLSIIHKDIRPENIVYSNGKYYLLDLELMDIGDIDYDFTRILNLLNQKSCYKYENFKDLMEGYKSVNNIKISEGKWQLYNKFYAFRIYSRMLSGKINRDSEYEKYLKDILIGKHDRVTEWIKRYNEE